MATDPYFEVQAEVQSALQNAGALFESYQRVYKTVPRSSHGTSEELSWARDELKATLIALESDLGELEDSVRVVESGGPRMFGIDENELRGRKAFVASVKSEVQRMRSAVAPSTDAKAPIHRPERNVPSYRDDLEGDPNVDFERQQQSLLYEEQDRTLSSIGRVVGTLREQATVMGREVFEQVGILEDFSNDVDRSESRLARANKRMAEFVRQNRSSRSSWCILLLIVVLVFLLLAIILL